jgi:hypothetical protein
VDEIEVNIVKTEFGQGRSDGAGDVVDLVDYFGGDVEG